MASRWYCAHILGNLEKTAIFHLARQNYQSFSPQIITTRDGVTEVFQSLFQSYIFVRFDVEQDQWRSINGTRGIIGLLPKRKEIPDPMVEGFVEYFIETGPVRMKGVFTVFTKFYPGLAIKIKDGLLKGKKGTVLEVGSSSVEVLLDTPFFRKLWTSKDNLLAEIEELV